LSRCTAEAVTCLSSRKPVSVSNNSLMKTLFIALRAIFYLIGSVVFWGWLALAVRPNDRDIGLLLPAWTEVPGILLLGVGGLLFVTCVVLFIFRGRGTLIFWDSPRGSWPSALTSMSGTPCTSGRSYRSQALDFSSTLFLSYSSPFSRSSSFMSSLSSSKNVALKSGLAKATLNTRST
jgi:hypothetical protein